MTEMPSFNFLTTMTSTGVNSICNVFISFFMFSCFVAYYDEVETHINKLL